MKTLVKNILGAVALSGIVLIGIGAKIDNKKIEYTGAGVGVAVIGYAIANYNQEKKRKNYIIKE